MLKYLYSKQVFREIPDEFSYAVEFSGCTLHCKGCHSRELWEDKGIPFAKENIDIILKENKGITCLLLMGGEHAIGELIELFMYAHRKIKTAWYCGLDMIPKDKLGILDYLDFCKLGHYDMELGGLDCPTTNQRLYQFSPYFSDCTILGAGWRDITYKLQNHADKR